MISLAPTSLALLGNGTHGCVFRYKDTSHSCVIKCALETSAWTCRLLQEYHILRYLSQDVNLSTKHICALYTPLDICLYQQKPALALCTYDKSLFDILQLRHQFSLPKVISIAHQLAIALIHLNERHVVHSDVKLANILISDDKVALTDFGCARIASTLHRAPITEQAYSYRAPEVWLVKERDFTPFAFGGEIDVWSLGVVLGELYTLSKLFHAAQGQIHASHYITEHETVLERPYPSQFIHNTGSRGINKYRKRPLVSTSIPLRQRIANTAIICADTISAQTEFFQLLTGMLDYDPEARWTPMYIRSFLQKNSKRKREYTHYTSPSFPVQLLHDISDLQAQCIRMDDCHTSCIWQWDELFCPRTTETQCALMTTSRVGQRYLETEDFFLRYLRGKSLYLLQENLLYSHTVELRTDYLYTITTALYDSHFFHFLSDADHKQLVTKSIFIQLACAIMHLQQEGIIHNRICPESIFINHAGEIRLGGFFQACFSTAMNTVAHIDTHEMSTLALPTVYSSPERLAEQSITFSSDIYSLGAILQQCGPKTQNAIDCAQKMLQSSPKERITIEEVMSHPFCTEDATCI